MIQYSVRDYGNDSDIGVNGKVWRVIRNIYEVVESTVILGEELTEWFSVELGLKQGCTLSPLLFLIFVEGLSQKLRKCSVGLKAGHLAINHLLFADESEMTLRCARAVGKKCKSFWISST